jgi:hypothetical protein
MPRALVSLFGSSAGALPAPIISRVGQAWSVLESSQGGSLDLGKNLFICMIDSTTPFDLWDLNTAGPLNKDINVPAAGLGGSGAAEFLAQMAGENTFAIEYDERRGHHVAWQRGGRVYVIEAPASAPWDTGWTVTKIADDTLPVRPLTVAELNAAVQTDTSVTGKWRRSPVLDVYIGMQKYTDGDVWAFKPDNWVDPR